MRQVGIIKKRVHQFCERVVEQRYGAREPLAATYTYDSGKPIPIKGLKSRSWKPISLGTKWGDLWGSAWFQIIGQVPKEFAGKEVVALVDLGGEGCVFVDGEPFVGLTDVGKTLIGSSGKRRIPLYTKAKGGEKVNLLIEAGANQLFGAAGVSRFEFSQAELAVLNHDIWQLGLDLTFLIDLAETLPEESTRSRKLWRGLNDAANEWRDGAGYAQCQAICTGLLKPRANASAPTVWSIGHAHLDLGWLWPVRETRRKAGRTFSTALQMMKEYPDYYFGASQPQAFAWVKEDYPKLYGRIKKAVAEGRLECQGAMWVEPDMNISSGESLVRQLLYGKRFFRTEFGVEVDNLWLPDVFGYSAALPQILKKAGVDYFLTQKISWNETNTFPHHSFRWEGIDGTEILTHFLPTNTYNLRNAPSELLPSEERFAQADISDDFLNLYGIGDGGGGPSRYHIEFARRAADTEGLPKVKMARAGEFFKRLGRIDRSRLPLWRGELYLELHRGTYTTQALMKKLNRRLEHVLHDAEFFSVLSGSDQRTELRAIWYDTMLNQFHDILPGSSITKVYEDAHRVSKANLEKLATLTDASLTRLFGAEPRRPHRYHVYNTLAWARRVLVLLPSQVQGSVVTDIDGRHLPVQVVEDGVIVPVSGPSAGYTTLFLGNGSGSEAVARVVDPVHATRTILENGMLRVTLAEDGTISSMYDKPQGREVLAGPANRLMLWEDHPYGWDAWDISHYYRETAPEQAQLVGRRRVENGPLRAMVEQRLKVGNSTIHQCIVLEEGSSLVRIENDVEWSEEHRQLRVQAEPAIMASEATYEIQYGAVRRPTHGNTSWDQARFEVAGQRFADVSQPDYGFALLNDCKYGHYVRDGVVDLTLLRSPKSPDPDADQGRHAFTFAYYPHASTLEESDVLEQAHELNAPIVLRGVAENATASPKVADAAPSWQDPGSQFVVEGGVVKLETIKRAEDGDAVILRLYETRGSRHEVILVSRKGWTKISEVDLMEENPRIVKGGRGSFRTLPNIAAGSRISLEFGPYEIRTFRAEFT